MRNSTEAVAAHQLALQMLWLCLCCAAKKTAGYGVFGNVQAVARLGGWGWGFECGRACSGAVLEPLLPRGWGMSGVATGVQNMCLVVLQC